MSLQPAIRPLAYWLGLTVIMPLALGLGCGRSSRVPGQIEISGNVTFNSQPVSGGMIYFEPDAMVGNGGPQGFAEIIDGRYSTRESGRGVVPGPHMVRIEEQQPIEGEKARPMQFYEYSTKAELTDAAMEHDFEIPADAGKRKGRR